MGSIEASPLARLRRDGIVHPFGRIDVAPILLHLADKTVWNAHVRAKASASAPLQDVLRARRWAAFAHSLHDIVRAPVFLEAALALRPLAEEYFGEEPVLYSMNAFWTQPAMGDLYADTHDWHRDTDDRKQLALFVYGTDIPAWDDGAHLYQPGTHNAGTVGNAQAFPVMGDAGTAFLCDPSGLHMGVRPTRTARLFMWARWGVSTPPDAYKWDQLEPIPAAALGDRVAKIDPVGRRAIRFLVQP